MLTKAGTSSKIMAQLHTLRTVLDCCRYLHKLCQNLSAPEIEPDSVFIGEPANGDATFTHPINSHQHHQISIKQPIHNITSTNKTPHTQTHPTNKKHHHTSNQQKQNRVSKNLDHETKHHQHYKKQNSQKYKSPKIPHHIRTNSEGLIIATCTQ